MSDMVKSFIALIISIIVVHLIYIGYIRPEAAMMIELAKQQGLSAPRDIVVVLKDYEQEICFILMLWGTFLILDKCRTILKTNFLFNVEYIEVGNDKTFSVEHAIDNIDKGIEEKYKEMPLIKTIRSALWRYAATRNVQNLSDAIESSVEAMTVRQEAENSMIRYLIWAIPSIGFIGTVRGIGEALSLADKALAGDIAGMTDSLGVAFNSTLVALLLSIFLMFLFHQLQRLQDVLVVQIQEYCDRHILAKLK